MIENLFYFENMTKSVFFSIAMQAAAVQQIQTQYEQQTRQWLDQEEFNLGEMILL